MENGFGTKFLKLIIVSVVALILLAFIIPPVFGIFGPIITALPFSTPLNFIVADYMGIIFIAATTAGLLYLSYKISWR